jgi:hypothetical protein
VSFELTARRHLRSDATTYDWHVGIGWDADSPHRLVLAHEHRPRWPELVREYGLTHLRSIAFTEPEERMLFGLDCDL